MLSLSKQPVSTEDLASICHANLFTTVPFALQRTCSPTEQIETGNNFVFVQPCNPQLLELLTKWGVKILYPTCIEQEINLEILKYMTPRHCELLTKNFKLATVVKFEYQLRLWQIQGKTTIGSNCSDISNENAGEKETDLTTRNSQSVLFKKSHSDTSMIELEDMLVKTSQGRSIIDKYKSLNQLNDGCRTILVDLIINYLIQNDIKMTVNLAEDITKQIVALFPMETSELYFLRERGRAPMGKIYCKYFNQLRTLKNSGLITKRPEKPSTSFFRDQEQPISLDLEIESHIDENLEAIRSDNCSWSELEHHWKATTKYRITLIKTTDSTEQIMSEYKQYKRPLGYKLIEIDFNTAFPNAGSFINEFPKSFEKLLHLYKKRIKDPTSCALLSDLNKMQNISENSRYAIGLYLLHAVLIPTGKEVILNNNKKLHRKFSIKDSQNSFIMLGNTLQEIEANLEKSYDTKQAIEPFIIITGTLFNPQEILVYFYGIKFKFSSTLQAVDTCFKIFNLFNLKYPLPSVLVWQFLQKYFYRIDSKNDKNNPYLTYLVNEMKKDR